MLKWPGIRCNSIGAIIMGTVGESYRNFEHTESYDAVVIGSGIGGLGVAALLKKISAG